MKELHLNSLREGQFCTSKEKNENSRTVSSSQSLCFIFFPQVKMSDLDTQEELEFQFDKWLGKDKEESGGHIGCEMPVVREGQEPLTGKTSGLLQ